jgi:hypothetical protein
MVSASANAFADGYFRATDLIDLCRVDSKACGAYLMGVSDTHSVHVTWGDTKALHCMPGEVTSKQLVLVVGKYLAEHPELHHLGAAGLALTAMSEAWPCR